MPSYKDPGTGFLIFKDNLIQRVSGLPHSATLDDIEVSTSSDSITATDTRNKRPLWEYSERVYGTVVTALYSTPVIYKRKVYVGANGCSLVALDLDTGKEKWRFIVKDKFGDNRGWFPSNTPAVAKDRVYFPSVDCNQWEMEEHYWLHCLDANSGNEIWRYRTWGYCDNPQPVVTNNVVVLGSNSLYFLDTETGRKSKRIKFAPSFSLSSAWYVKSVIMVGKKIYFDTNNDCLYAIKEK